MKEIVTLHFGQAGVQMGNSTWELLCLEHCINEEGQLREEPREIECLETFFSLSQNGNFVPRTAYIDLEPSVIDEVRQSSFRHLFHPDRLITGPEDSASNFARGFFTVGKLILNTINCQLRRMMESSDNVQGIIIFRGLGGGTGSGLTSAIFDHLAEYPKTFKLEMPIYPSPTLSTSTVEPYNCLLAQHFCMEDIDLGLLFDNESIYDICTKNLKKDYADYTSINRLIAQICNNLTVSLRFENTICSDLSVLQTNLVPYPRIHFPVCNFAPVISEKQSSHICTTVSELTRSVFDPNAQMMHIDNSFGRIMSCALSYRGDISPYHVYISLIEMKKKKEIEFVDWCPTGFRVGINLNPPVVVPDSGLAVTKRNVTLLMNTSAISQVWRRLTHKFHMLYSKKSFVHWFVGEGMEECEFTESLYNIGSLVKDYEECVVETLNTETTELNTENVYFEPQTNQRCTKEPFKDKTSFKNESDNKTTENHYKNRDDEKVTNENTVNESEEIYTDSENNPPDKKAKTSDSNELNINKSKEMDNLGEGQLDQYEQLSLDEPSVEEKLKEGLNVENEPGPVEDDNNQEISELIDINEDIIEELVDELTVEVEESTEEWNS